MVEYAYLLSSAVVRYPQDMQTLAAQSSGTHDRARIGHGFLARDERKVYNTSYDSRQLPDISCTEVHASCLHVRIAENTTRMHPVSRVTLANRGHLAWTLFTTSSKLRLHQMSPWIPMNRAVAVLIRTSTQNCITMAWTWTQVAIRKIRRKTVRGL